MAQPVKISAMKDLVVDDGVAPCPSHRSISPVAIDQDKGVGPFPQDDPSNDRPEALSGTGQGKNPLRLLNPPMGIAKREMGHLDLFDFSKISTIHDHLTLDGEIDLPPAPCIRKNDTACSCQTLSCHCQEVL